MAAVNWWEWIFVGLISYWMIEMAFAWRREMVKRWEFKSRD